MVAVVVVAVLEPQQLGFLWSVPVDWEIHVNVLMFFLPLCVIIAIKLTHNINIVNIIFVERDIPLTSLQLDLQ